MFARKVLLITIVTASICLKSKGQEHTREFEISMPETKASGSLYNKISLLDSRSDTTQMGILQTGAFNRKAKVVARKPLSTQLNTIIAALTGANAKDGELILQLRQLSFAEVIGAVSEKGYFFFRANLYTRLGKDYYPLASIDTAVVLKSSWDVTKGIFKAGSNMVSRFVSDNLLQSPHGQGLAWQNILQIDSVEKAGLKIYNDTSWQDGLYLSWNSFKQQLPDQLVAEAKIKKGDLESVKIFGKDSMPEKIKSKNAYAVVYKGQPFIATDYGYYPLSRNDGELYFTGKAKVSANAGDVIAASMFFGIIGGLLASDATGLFYMKIDHLSGGFIHLREIQTATSQ